MIDSIEKIVVRAKRLPAFRVILVSCAIAMIAWLWAPPAWAITDIQLFDLDYKDCPAELSQGAVTSGDVTAANCFLIAGKAKNPSGKTVYDADVFGRIYDANNNNVLPNRTRLGSLEEVPPGVSDFELRISVAANLPTPLQLKNFKARGFSSSVKFLLPE